MSTDKKCSSEMALKVFYEFTMFEFLFERLRFTENEMPILIPGEMVEAGTSPMATEQRREVLAQLESFLLHVRVLRDFFYTPGRDDDIVAGHFIANWSKICPTKGRYLKDQKTRLDKALAHLTEKRLDYDGKDKKWQVTKLYKDLHPVIEVFIANLPNDRKPWFCGPPEPVV